MIDKFRLYFNQSQIQKMYRYIAKNSYMFSILYKLISQYIISRYMNKYFSWQEIQDTQLACIDNANEMKTICMLSGLLECKDLISF